MTGARLPEKMENRPEVIVGLDLYWKAFTDLMSERELGMAEGPIRWTAMSEWAARRGIYGDDFERFVYLMREMDSTYMDYRGRKSKRDAAKTKRAGRKAKAIGRK